jgi:hypothetical protein
VTFLLFAWIVFLQAPTLDPARGYGGAVVVTQTPYIVFVRDPADFPITVTPSHVGSPPTASTPAQLPGWLAPAIIVAIISAVVSLVVSYLDRRQRRPQVVNEIRLGGDKFLLDKVAALERDNERLEERLQQMTKRMEELEGAHHRERMLWAQSLMERDQRINRLQQEKGA